jgi:hypothetical protein
MDAAWRQGITRKRRPRKTIFSGTVNPQQVAVTFKDRLTRVGCRVRGALRKEKGRLKTLSSLPPSGAFQDGGVADARDLPSTIIQPSRKELGDRVGTRRIISGTWSCCAQQVHSQHESA